MPLHKKFPPSRGSCPKRSFSRSSQQLRSKTKNGSLTENTVEEWVLLTKKGLFMADVMLNCHQCGAQWAVPPPVSRREDCPQCGRDAHVCLNCRFYDPHAHRSCREPQAEFVQDKEHSNYCNYFEPSHQSQRSEGQNSVKQRLESLFHKDPSPESPRAPQSDDLKAQLEQFMKNKNKAT